MLKKWQSMKPVKDRTEFDEQAANTPYVQLSFQNIAKMVNKFGISSDEIAKGLQLGKHYL